VISCQGHGGSSWVSQSAWLEGQHYDLAYNLDKLCLDGHPDFLLFVFPAGNSSLKSLLKGLLS